MTILRIFAILFVGAGLIWVGQGVGWIQGSFMTSQTKWVWIGSGMIVAGIGMFLMSRKRGK